MASGGDDLCAKFEDFSKLAGGKPHEMQSKAIGKLVKDCLECEKDLKKHDVKSICDASVFPICKEKGKTHMVINKANCEKFCHKTAVELAKRQTKNNKIADDDPAVVEMEEKVKKCIMSHGPDVKIVKQSATGNVGGLTDASKYTGAHKERFDADGKGKGIDGRADRHSNDGYVGNYKNKDTYGTKK